MAYIFRKTRDSANSYDSTDVEFRVEHVTWPDLVEEFANFLRGCGFSLPDGSLDFVGDEPDREYLTLDRVEAALRRVPPDMRGFCLLTDVFVEALHTELNRAEEEA